MAGPQAAAPRRQLRGTRHRRPPDRHDTKETEGPMAVAAKKTRGKAAALDVPQNDDEANVLLAEYGALFNDVARIEADMNDALVKAKTAAEEESRPLLDRMGAIYLALNAFA